MSHGLEMHVMSHGLKMHVTWSRCMSHGLDTLNRLVSQSVKRYNVFAAQSTGQSAIHYNIISHSVNPSINQTYDQLSMS